MKQTDDILKSNLFNPPYRFIVGSYSEEDGKGFQLVYVVDDPAVAYLTYQQVVDVAIADKFSGSILLLDSFNKDALEFCKKLAENPPALPISEEIKNP